jgi:hypothetical protein
VAGLKTSPLREVVPDQLEPLIQCVMWLVIFGYPL